jgi:hypothetical protein
VQWCYEEVTKKALLVVLTKELHGLRNTVKRKKKNKKYEKGPVTIQLKNCHPREEHTTILKYSLHTSSKAGHLQHEASLT